MEGNNVWVSWKYFNLSSNDGILKKCAKNKFLALVKKVHFSEFFGQMSNFTGLWFPNHCTYIDSWSFIGKIISTYFI